MPGKKTSIVRPPYVTETAKQYYDNVIVKFLKKCKMGYSNSADDDTTSYECFHWHREKHDDTVALVFKDDHK